MLTKEQIIGAVKAGRKSECLDSRDYSRLLAFFDADHFSIFGFHIEDGATHTPTEFTRETVLEQLKRDVSFGFEKALAKRGISSDLMYEVVKMWMWVLEDELQYHDRYAMYGLPLFRAVAIKYGFDNHIGDDEGNEEKYNE